MELISVIIPVYNVEAYIARCLDSVINQTYKNIEIILVNDGSNDNSGKICDEYAAKDKRIVVIHQKNMGASSARNAGLNKANGKYVCFIDSDDTVENNYIEELLKPLKEKDYDLVICNINDIYENKTSGSRKITCTLDGVLERDYYKLVELLRVPVIKLYKMEIIIKYGLKFPEEIFTAEDQIWNFSYYSHVRDYFFINKSLYNYHHREGTLSCKNSYESFKNNLYKLSLEKEFLLENNIYNARTVLNNHAFFCFEQFLLLKTNGDNYFKLKKRWYAIRKYIDFNDVGNSTKIKIRNFLGKHDFIFLLYIYYNFKYFKKNLFQ